MKGKIALVTGGSRGIGRAIAVKLAQEGCDVAILYAGRKEAADETVSLLTAAGARALAVQCNVADEKAAEAAVKEVAQALGPIDIPVSYTHLLAFSREGAGFVCVGPPMPQVRHPAQSQTSGSASLLSVRTCNSVKNSSSRAVKRLSMW